MSISITSTPALTRQVITNPPVRMLYKLIAVILVSSIGTFGLGLSTGTRHLRRVTAARVLVGIDCGR